MADFTIRIDDDIAAVIDAEIKGAMPRVSRNAFIEAILFERYRKEITKLRARRQAEAERSAADAQTNPVEMAA